MQRFFARRSQGFSLIVLTLLAISANDAVAGGAPPDQPAPAVFRSALGWQLVPPTGFGLRHLPAPADATPRQIAETLTLTQQGAERIRIDVYRNAQKQRLDDWISAEMTRETEGAHWQQVPATPAKVPAMLANMPKSPQRHAQQLVFFASGDFLVQISCLIGADPLVAVGCAEATARWELGSPAVRGGSK